MLLSLAGLLAAADDNTAANAVKNAADVVARTAPNEQAFSDFADLAGKQPLSTPTLTYALPLALVLTGFFLHIALEMWSEKGLNFRPHFIRLIVFTVAVNGYVPLSKNIAGFVLSLGAVSETGVAKQSEKTRTFLAAQRTKYFQRKKEMEEEIKSLNEQGAQFDRRPVATQIADGASEGVSNFVAGKIESVGATFFFSIIQMSVELSFLFASIAIWFLKMLQTAMMNVILGVGPLMIAFSSWPGVTSRYFSAWVSALIETAAWGIFSGTLIRLLASNAENKASSGEDGGMFEFVGLNILYAASLISVPAITSSVLRGSAAGGSMMSGMLGAATATATRIAGAVNAGAKAATSLTEAPLDGAKNQEALAKDSRSVNAAADSAYVAPQDGPKDPPKDPPSTSGDEGRRKFFRDQAANKKRDGQ